MANTDSFIEEVTEEVRRDRLFAAFRKYGWIGVVAILAVVGAAIFREWSISERASAAQAFGDGVLSGLSAEDAEQALTAFNGLETKGDQAAVAGFAKAAALLEDGRASDAAGELAAIAGNESISRVYRDIAVLKEIWILGDELNKADALARLAPLEVPGAPFRLLAAEAKAYVHLRNGETADAIETLKSIEQDTRVPPGLRNRVSQLLAILQPGDDEEL